MRCIQIHTFVELQSCDLLKDKIECISFPFHYITKSDIVDGLVDGVGKKHRCAHRHLINLLFVVFQSFSRGTMQSSKSQLKANWIGRRQKNSLLITFSMFPTSVYKNYIQYRYMLCSIVKKLKHIRSMPYITSTMRLSPAKSITNNATLSIYI